jgi:membrane associated rhomboid family serine protease
MATAPTPTTCFHHPERETGRRCTRCGRPACGDCLIQAAVGSQCFECVRATAPSQRERIATGWRGARLLATKTIVAINVAMFVFIAVRDGDYDGIGRASAQLVLYGPAVHDGEWWRIVTSSVVHFGLFHIGFNMLVLWQVGTVLEPAAGRLRFALLYLVSVIAGAAGALLLDPLAFTGGASGGVFGVAAAATLMLHRYGVRFWDTGFGPLLLINLFLGFFISNISIGGHIGGLIGGALAAEGMLQARRANQPRLGIAVAVFVGVAAFLLALVAASR